MNGVSMRNARGLNWMGEMRIVGERLNWKYSSLDPSLLNIYFIGGFPASASFLLRTSLFLCNSAGEIK